MALPVFLAIFYHHFRWKIGAAVFAGFSALLIIAYVFGLSLPIESKSGSPGLAVRLFHIFCFAENYFGAPWKVGPVNLSNGTGIGATITTIVFLVSVYRFVSGRVAPYSLENFSFAIVMFIVGSGILTALGRAEMGMEGSRSNRFFIGTEMQQFAVGTLLILWNVKKFWPNGLPRISVIAVTLVAALMLPEQTRAIVASVRGYHDLRMVQAALSQKPDDKPALHIIYPDAAIARRTVALMEKHHLYGIGQR